MTHPTRAALDAAIADALRGHRLHEYERVAADLAIAAKDYIAHVEEKRAEAPNILAGAPATMATTGARLLLLSQWLDSWNIDKPVSTQVWERVGKVGEESGEVFSAMIGWAAQNPRKGLTHDQRDVEKELYDVVITALGAILHLHKNDPDFPLFGTLFEQIGAVWERLERAIEDPCAVSDMTGAYRWVMED